MINLIYYRFVKHYLVVFKQHKCGIVGNNSVARKINIEMEQLLMNIEHVWSYIHTNSHISCTYQQRKKNRFLFFFIFIEKKSNRIGRTSFDS